MNCSKQYLDFFLEFFICRFKLSIFFIQRSCFLFEKENFPFLFLNFLLFLLELFLEIVLKKMIASGTGQNLQVLGNICLKKVIDPLVFSEKICSPPNIYKIYLRPLFISKKVNGPSPGTPILQANCTVS